MSRIFPDIDYNLYEDFNNPRNKNEWGYGYEASSNEEFINYENISEF